MVAKEAILFGIVIAALVGSYDCKSVPMMKCADNSGDCPMNDDQMSNYFSGNSKWSRLNTQLGWKNPSTSYEQQDHDYSQEHHRMGGQQHPKYQDRYYSQTHSSNKNHQPWMKAHDSDESNQSSNSNESNNSQNHGKQMMSMDWQFNHSNENFNGPSHRGVSNSRRYRGESSVQHDSNENMNRISFV